MASFNKAHCSFFFGCRSKTVFRLFFKVPSSNVKPKLLGPSSLKAQYPFSAVQAKSCKTVSRSGSSFVVASKVAIRVSNSYQQCPNSPRMRTKDPSPVYLMPGTRIRRSFSWNHPSIIIIFSLHFCLRNRISVG